MGLRKLKEFAGEGLGAAVPAPRGVLAKLWPWLVALAILAFLFTRIPPEGLFTAFKTGPWLSLGLYTLFQVALLLMVDAYATSVSLAVTGFKQQFSLIFLARGATYILGILNYALGQGAFGFYLRRSGVATVRAAGTILFLINVNIGVLLSVVAFGLLACKYPRQIHFDLSPLAYVLLVGVIVYLAVILTRPHFLRDYQLLAPLWEAGVWGHVRAAGARLPHVILLILTYWGALRLCGIPVPLAQGMVLIPLVYIIGTLPIAPMGLGTSQAALVLLFSPYAPLSAPEARAAAMLAFGLMYYFFGIVAQALLGFWCWQKLRHLN